MGDLNLVDLVEFLCEGGHINAYDDDIGVGEEVQEGVGGVVVVGVGEVVEEAVGADAEGEEVVGNFFGVGGGVVAVVGGV